MSGATRWGFNFGATYDEPKRHEDSVIVELTRDFGEPQFSLRSHIKLDRSGEDEKRGPWVKWDGVSIKFI